MRALLKSERGGCARISLQNQGQFRNVFNIFFGDSCSSGFVVVMYCCFSHFKFYFVEDCVLFLILIRHTTKLDDFSFKPFLQIKTKKY